MKITALSDIHYPHNEKQLDDSLESMVDSDVIVIAGDISHDLEEYELVLSRFSGLACKKLIVIGNHDLYTEDGSDSYRKIKVLNRICKRNDFHLLDSGPLVIDGVGFVGNIGWYDYSFAQGRDHENQLPQIEFVGNCDYSGHKLFQIQDINEEVLVYPNDEEKSSRSVRIRDLTDSDFSQKSFIFRDKKNHYINDSDFIHWKFSDKEFLDLQLGKLSKHLRKVEKKCDKIIYVSHFVPIWNFIYSDGCDSVKRVFNAYHGSPELGNLAFSNDKLAAIISGHTHHPNQVRVNDVMCYDVSYRLRQLKPTQIVI
ncbi:hypothetical protein GOV12_04650 [Candidatus Pacearchaeota archaeon]|nr:hypothetical protein [Candidatus Pacearchaeota archaeon]